MQSQSTILIVLVNLKGIAVVDTADADLLQRHWFLHSAGYATAYAGKVRRKTVQVKMHRVVMARTLSRDLLATEQVDHADGNPLNNRRANLRLCNHKQNSWNVSGRGGTSRFKGVCWDKRADKWIVQIRD